MGQYYTIFGKKVPSHILAIATLASVTAVAAWPRKKKEEETGIKQASPIASATAAAVAAPALADINASEDFDLEKWINEISREDAKN